MGKKRLGELEAVETVMPEAPIEFVDIPQRPFKVVSLDFTVDQIKAAAVISIRELEGAVVKPVIRYHAGDEAAAQTAMDGLIKNIRKVAHFVRPIEKIVVRRHSPRMEDIKHDQAPMVALDVWLKKRPPPQDITGEEVRVRLREYLDGLTLKPERAYPHTMALRGFVLTNWMCFRGTMEVAGIPDGLIGITAEYDNQTDRSNRGGKSALMESVLFGSFGEARKLQSSDMYIYDGEDKMSVGIGWELDDEPYPVTRELGLSSRGSAKSQMYLGQTGVSVREGNAEIIERFGMDRGDFGRTCFVQQGDLNGMLDQTSGQLKADIIRWRGLAMWDQLEAAISAHLSNARKKLETAQSSLEVSKEIVAEGSPEQDEIETMKTEIKQGEQRVAKAEASGVRATALDVLIRLAESVEGARRVVATRKELEKELSAAESQKEKWDAMFTTRIEVVSTVREELVQCEVVARGEFDGECTVDHEACPRTDEINKGRNAARKRGRAIEKRLEAAKDKRDDAELNQRAQQQRIRTANMELTKVGEAEKLIEKHQAVKSADEYHRERDDLEKPDDFDQMEFEDEIQGIRDHLADAMAAVRRRDQAVDDVNKHTEEEETWTRHVKVLQYIRFLCGKKGIPSMMIEDALADIEAEVNNILEDLGTDHRLEFQYERVLKRPARMCYDCGAVFDESAKMKFCKGCGAERQNERTDDLSPMVRDGERVQTFAQDSGAGRALMALAVRVAMSRFLGARVLFLDEVCGALDDYHLPIMIRLLHKLPSMGFQQVFVISHQREVAAAMPQNILITRYPEESRSVVTWEDANG